MRKIMIAAAAAFMLATQAGAVCTSLGSGLGLKLPNYGDRGDVWAKCVRDNFQAMNDGLLPSTAATSYVLKSAPSLTGGLLSTSWANFISSVTAGAGFYGTFYGSGANLSGVVTSTAVGTYPHSISGNAATATTAGTATNNVLKAGDNMTGQLTTASSMTAQAVLLNNNANPSLTFKGNNENNGGAIFFKNSSAGASDYDWKLWHQPYLNGVLANKLYLYPRSSVGGYAQTWTDWGVGIFNGSPAYALDVTGGIRATSTMTASAYYGDGSNLTGVIPSTATGYYPIYVASAAYAANGGSGGSGGTPLFGFDNFYSQTNGAQTAFVLTSTPVANSLNLTKNGVALVATADYSLTDRTITMVSAPASSTTLAARYVVGYTTDTISNVTATNNNWTGTNTFSGSVTVSSLTVTNATLGTVYISSFTTHTSTMFGAYSEKTAGTIYQTATDGFVMCRRDGSGDLLGYIGVPPDSSATSQVAKTSIASGAIGGSIMFPVPANYYYRATSCTIMWFIPIGR